MCEIIKSLFYKEKNNVIIYLMILCVIILPVLNISNISDTKITGSVLAVNNIGSCFYYLLLCLVISGIVIGSDFIDKTINYEIMSGHNKEQMYFGRLIVAFIITILSLFVALVVPFILVSLKDGWGETIYLKDFVIRVLLMVFPIFKFISLIQLLSFVLKNHYGAIGFGFAVAFMEFTLSSFDAIPEVFNKFLIFDNLKTLFTFETKINEVGAISYISNISNSDMMNIIIANISIGFCFVMIGYLFFKKSDLE